jgi:hypothetical protein
MCNKNPSRIREKVKGEDGWLTSDKMTVRRDGLLRGGGCTSLAAADLLYATTPTERRRRRGWLSLGGVSVLPSSSSLTHSGATISRALPRCLDSLTQDRGGFFSMTICLMFFHSHVGVRETGWFRLVLGLWRRLKK